MNTFLQKMKSEIFFWGGGVGGGVGKRGRYHFFSPNILKKEIFNAQKKGLEAKNEDAQDSPAADFYCIITDPRTIESLIHRSFIESKPLFLGNLSKTF